MRAAVLTGLLLLAASSADAAPFAVSPNPITLPSQETLTARYALARAKENATLPDGYAPHIRYTPSDRGFGIGPIHADGEDAAGFGRRHGPKPHYRLEGMSVLGGSIGGSVDGRGAMLSLHWGDGN